MSYITEEKQDCPTRGEGNTFSPCRWSMQTAWSVMVMMMTTMMAMTMMATIFIGVKRLWYCWKKL